MKNAVLVLATILCYSISTEQAQAQTVTVIPRKDANQVGVPAGQVAVSATGAYTLANAQVVNKVIVHWYKQVAGNLIFVGDSIDNAPAANAYATGSIGVDINDGMGKPLLYTCIAELFVTTAANPIPASVASGVATNFKP